MSGARLPVIIVAVAIVVGLAVVISLPLVRGESTNAAITSPVRACVDVINTSPALVTQLLTSIEAAEPAIAARHDEVMKPYESADGKERPWPGLAINEPCPGGVQAPRNFGADAEEPMDTFVVTEPVPQAPAVPARFAIVPANLPALNGAAFIRLPYEAVCEQPKGYPCNEVSVAVYISESAVTNVDTVTRAVNAVMGFGLTTNSRPDTYDVEPPAGKTVVN